MPARQGEDFVRFWKRGKPHDRKWDATSPHPLRGGSHRGGEKPRGWNKKLKLVASTRSLWKHKLEWTREGTTVEGRLAARSLSQERCAQQ